MELTKSQRIKLAEAALRRAKKLNPNRDAKPTDSDSASSPASLPKTDKK